MKISRNIRVLTVLGLYIAYVGTAPAADITKGSSGTDLNDGASWGGTAPTLDDTATWSGTSLGAGLTMGSAASWGGIKVTGATSDIDISGAGSLTLGSGGIDLAASTVNLSLSNNITLDAAQTWKAAAGKTLSESGVISGSAGLTFGALAPTVTSTTFLTASDQTLFTNASLASVVSTSGKMGGAWVGGGTPINGTGYLLSNDGSSATYWLEAVDGTYTKGVAITLTQSGADITAKATAAKYITSVNLGYNFNTGGTAGTLATSQTGGGYGAHTTTLKLGYDSTGTVVLSGVNTYSGPTNVAVGILRAGVASEAGVGGAFGNDSALSIANVAGTGIDLNGFHTQVGSITGGGATGGNITLGSATLTVGGDNTSPAAYAGAISGTGGLTKIGTGTLVLSGANTFTGPVTISGGMVKIGINPAALTYGAFGPSDYAVSKVTIAAGATVDLNGNDDDYYGYTIAGTGTSGQGALVNTGANTVVGHIQHPNITLAEDAMIGGSGNIYQIAGSYAANSLDLAGHTLTKAGTNTYFLVNTTVSAGAVHITGGGIAQAQAASNASAAAFTLADSAGVLLNLNGFNLSIGSLSGGGATGGNVVLGNKTLTVGGDNSSPAAYAGAISGTGGSVTKTGSGTLTLTGTNSYTGATTVNQGTLAGSGSFAGPVDIKSDAILSPGVANIGALTVNNTLALAGSAVFEINKSGATLTNDTITGLTSVTYGGTLTVSATGDTLVAGDKFTLFVASAYTSSSFTSLSLPPLPANLSWDVSGLLVDGSIMVVDYVATPIFSPAAGGYVGAQSVTISSSTGGATIHYTMDGSDPATSPTAEAAITPVSGVVIPTDTATQTLRAYATKAESANSPESSATYSTVTTPTWNVNIASGNWSDSVNWLNSVIPDGSGVTADFNAHDQGSNPVVILDSNRTAGELIFGNANPIDWTLNPSNSSVLTLQTISGTPAIQVNNQAATIGANLTGTQGLAKTGDGTLILSGVNTITGGTTISGGVLQVGNGVGASATLPGNIDISANAILKFSYGTSGAVFAGNLSGGGALVLANGGTGYVDLRVQGDNSAFTGTLVVDGNGYETTFRCNSANALSSTNAVTLINFGSLSTWGYSAPEYNITIGSLASDYSNTYVRLGGGSGLTYGLTVGALGTNTTFAGVIKNDAGGTGTLTKVGSGTLTLTGVNTYSGATTVEGGTLAGTGAANSAVTVKDSATLSPGAGIGTMNTKAAAFESGSVFKVEVNSSTATADKLKANGNVTLTNPVLTCAETASGTIAGGTKLVIIDYTGYALTGTFNGYAEGAPVTVGANTYTLSYADASRVTLTAAAGGYTGWAALNGITGEAFEVDHDGDGMCNGMEYALGSVPTAFTAPSALTPAGADFSLTYQKGADAATDPSISYKFETSSNLLSWTQVDPTVESPTMVSYTLPGNAAPMFVRLKIVQIP